MATLQQLLDKLAALPDVAGVRAADVLELPDPLGAVLNDMVRHGPMPLSQFSQHLSLSLPEGRQVADTLATKGFLTCEDVEENGEVVCRVRFAHVRGRDLPSQVWDALEGSGKSGKPAP